MGAGECQAHGHLVPGGHDTVHACLQVGKGSPHQLVPLAPELPSVERFRRFCEVHDQVGRDDGQHPPRVPALNASNDFRTSAAFAWADSDSVAR